MTARKAPEKTAKVGEPQLRNYELVLIIRPEIKEESFDTIISNIDQLITQKGGVISNEERWGKRKLAYPIEHCTEGNYVLTQFKLKPVSSKELEASLEISEEVLRHLLVRLDG